MGRQKLNRQLHMCNVMTDVRYQLDFTLIVAFFESCQDS